MKIEKMLFKKGDPEWLKLRSRFVTGTDLPALFGFNEYSNPTKLWKSKLNADPIPEGISMNEHVTANSSIFTRMGKILEPAVMNLAIEVLGKEVRSFGDHRGDLMYYSQELRMSATPDAFIGKSIEWIDSLVELKSTSLKKLMEWQRNPPLHYLTQLATQCFLLNVSNGYLVIMHPRYPDLPSLIFYNELDIDRLGEIFKTEVGRFWKFFESGKGKIFKLDKDLAKEVTDLLTKNLEICHADLDLPPEIKFTEDPEQWWKQTPS